MTPDPRRILYRHVQAGRVIEVVEDEVTRSLAFDSHLTQSRMLLDDPTALVLRYTRRMMAALLFVEAALSDAPFRVLMIGLGGGSVVKFLLRGFPGCRMDVVESDPRLPGLARRFFHLPDDARLNVIVGEGGRFMARLPEAQRYDLILLDAFDQEGMAREVYTDPVLARAASRLTPRGVVALNWIRGDAQWFRLAGEALRRRFPGVVLRLEVPGFGNEILLAGPGLECWEDRETLERRAWSLAARLGIDFPVYVRALTRLESGGGWSRWLGAMAWRSGNG